MHDDYEGDSLKYNILKNTLEKAIENLETFGTKPELIYCKKHQ